jgi:hypothetical protein
MMGQNGTEFKGVQIMIMKDPDTNLPIFASSKLKYNIQKPIRNLEANVVYAPEVISPIDQKLTIESNNMFLKGIEGTLIDSQEVLFTAEHNIHLKSSNGSIDLHSKNGVFFDIDRIHRVEEVHHGYDKQYKLCICFPKGALYRVPLAKMRDDEPDPCRYFSKRHCL